MNNLYLLAKMEQQILQELESAAKIILAPPSVITNQQRAEAEAVFLNFRQTKCPYQICKYIFENSSIDYVIFETSNTIKEAVIREWNYMSIDNINSIPNYLLQHVLNHPNLAVFVREKILQVIAIMVKRGSITDMGNERRKLLGQVEQFIMCGELRKQILGCSLICALMQEYAITVKSADVGLQWETHLNAKKHFEMTDLKKILQLSVTTLGEICKVDGPFSDNALMLIKSLLQIAEGTLTWAFISSAMPKRIICIVEMSYESDYNRSLKLASYWKDVILVPNFLQLFFHLHWKIRDNANLTHLSLNCLVQLASLCGPILSTKSVKIDYVRNYIECFLNFLNNVEVVDREAIGVSNIFLKLLIFNELTIVTDLAGQEIITSFFQQMARLTCYFAEKASQQDSINYDESMFTEAFDNMLKAWNCLFRDDSEAIYKEASRCIFNSYLKWHLSPPYGFRSKVSTDDEVDDAEEEEDLNKYGSQLEAIGIFARQVPDLTIPTLAKLIDEKTYELRLMWQGTSNNNIQRDDLYEDLHWLLMIAGHVLTKEKDSMASLIPTKLMQYSLEKVSRINVNDSLNLLAMIDRPITPSDFASLEESTEHIIWLVSAVFRLSELEKQMGDAKLEHILSPTLSSTIAWFLQTWSHPYLLFSAAHYSKTSLAFETAFGTDTECAKWIVSFILNKIQSNFSLFHADPSIRGYTCKLLLSLVSTREKAVFLLKNQFFWNLISSGLESNNRYVSPDIKKVLVKSFTIAVSAFDGPEEKRIEYLNQIIKPITEKFRSIVLEENFKKQYHNEIVRSEILEIVHLFLGVVEGTGVIEETGITFCKCLFRYMSPVLPDMVTLLSIYHNYQQISQLILELFRECSHTMLCYLGKENERVFYETCLRLVETYVKHNSGRLTDEVNADEDSFNDMLIFMDLLSNLLSKEIIDFNSDEDNGCDETVVNSVNVCMLGLRGILPLMSVDTLKFPTLCSKFYTLLRFICELHAKKICDQPQEFLVSILAVIELGLTLFGPDITTLCCEFIQTFSKYLCQNSTSPHVPAEKFLLLQPFLKIMITIILSRQINSDNINAFGLAFHSLICCYKEYYTQLVEELISSQTDPELADRMSKAFTDLTSRLRLCYDRQEKMAFESNFEKFVFNIQGFLFIK